MITNQYGFLVPEADDFASPASCRLIAEEADRRIQDMRARLSGTKPPHAALYIPNGNALIAGGVTNFKLVFQQPLGFTTTLSPSDGSHVDFRGFVEPGLFLVGGTAAYTSIPGTVTRIVTRLVVQDPIGPKYTQDTFWYTSIEDCGTNSRNEAHHNLTNLVQIRSSDAEVYMDVTVVGTGNITLTAVSSSLWFTRLGDIIA